MKNIPTSYNNNFNFIVSKFFITEARVVAAIQCVDNYAIQSDLIRNWVFKRHIFIFNLVLLFYTSRKALSKWCEENERFRRQHTYSTTPSRSEHTADIWNISNKERREQLCIVCACGVSIWRVSKAKYLCWINEHYWEEQSNVGRPSISAWYDTQNK